MASVSMASNGGQDGGSQMRVAAARRDADRAQSDAQTLRAQAMNAQRAADNAQATAGNLAVEAGQADRRASETRRIVAGLQSGRQSVGLPASVLSKATSVESGGLRQAASASSANTGARASGIANLQGQIIGTRINVVA